jgi:hypothetical protein
MHPLNLLINKLQKAQLNKFQKFIATAIEENLAQKGDKIKAAISMGTSFPHSDDPIAKYAP